MNAALSSKNGRLVLEVTFNPTSCDWSEAIRAGLAAYGIQRHQVATVIAIPEPAADTSRHTKNAGPQQARTFDRCT
jgi:hypothetical protein